MGQHVFFDHIGQFVGGLLAALGEVVEATRERLHDPGHAGHHHSHDQRELPVQVQQVPQQGQQGEAIARDAQQGLHQQGGAGLHLVHHGIGQGTGRLAGEKTHFGGQQAVEQGSAQRQHAFVGNAGQRVLPHELGQAAHQEDSHDGHGHHPQLQRTIGEAFVQQRLQQRWNEGFGDGAYQRGDDGGCPAQPLAAKVDGKPRQPCHQAFGWGGGGVAGGGRGASFWGMHEGAILRFAPCPNSL